MITQIIHKNKQYQAYKEVSIVGNVIIEVFELVKFNQGFNHKFISSQAVDLKSNTAEDNPILIKLAIDSIRAL